MKELPQKIEKSKGPWKKGKKTYADLKEEFRKVSQKIDEIVESGGRVGLNDPLSLKLKQLQRQMNKQPD